MFTVAPHGDPSQIKLRYAGHDSLALDDNGNLVCTTSVGTVRETAPVVYQEIDGARVPVEGRFALLDQATVAFHVAAYDRDHPLVIDPTLVYAGFIGGSDRDDVGHAIAVDTDGNAYVTGETNATGFPAAVGPDLTFNGGIRDAFVAKVKADGTGLVYAGYLGGGGDPSVGGGDDRGFGIAVDGDGNAYITGYTGSTETDGFPVTVGPDLTHNGGRDAFVAKVSADGTTLVYAGYIGGAGLDEGHGIAVNSDGNVYVTGETQSTEATWPATVGPDLTFNGGRDAFVAKVSADGTALVYGGYIGGAIFDTGRGVAIDSAGNAYVTGTTNSTELTFPVTVGPNLTYRGPDSDQAGSDAFVAKVNATGTALVYAGYLGGTSSTSGAAIAVDVDGAAYVTGSTFPNAPSFALVGPDLTHNGGVPFIDAFVAKVNPAGTALVYAGYLGGDGVDSGTGIAVDTDGNAYVSGDTRSTEATFPVIGGPDLTHNGIVDAFVAKVNPAGNDLIYAGYLGGSSIDTARGIAVDSSGNAYVTGDTSSTDATFPVTVGPDLTSPFGFDGFVAKIAASPPNTAPVATDDTASTSEDTAVAIAVSTLLPNDTDAD
ncbi:MAG: SBBP repeat-containing protein, partial [Deltaproteobacteria bacterium]|nr:SBBP repeat-containing protein [Deltaproteobacteria bacterium]